MSSEENTSTWVVRNAAQYVRVRGRQWAQGYAVYAGLFLIIVQYYSRSLHSHLLLPLCQYPSLQPIYRSRVIKKSKNPVGCLIALLFFFFGQLVGQGQSGWIVGLKSSGKQACVVLMNFGRSG